MKYMTPIHSLPQQTVKTEPLDYPAEVAWSEGGLGREAGMEDSQGLLPAISASMAGGLEGVAAAIVASPNLPIIEFGESQHHWNFVSGRLLSVLLIL